MKRPPFYAFCILGALAWMSALSAFALSEEIAALIARPTQLNADVGSPNHPATTDSEQAQAFYNQGLGWTHSYFWIEAARSFRQALEHDENLALAHVGMALAYRQLGDMEASKERMARAMELREQASDRERRYIEARQTQWSADQAKGEERGNLMNQYRSELTRLVEDYPWDAELWVARGQAEESGTRGIGQRGRAKQAAWYEAALARDPSHIGALHYLTHCYENIRAYELAVNRAEKYGNRAKAAPHAQHMVGHVLPRAGRWEDAARRFARAHRLEMNYFKAENVKPGVEWHHLHNLHLYGMALMRLGKERQARQILQRALDIRKGGGEARRYWECLLHFERYDQVLKLTGEWEQDRNFAEAYAIEALLLAGQLEKARERLAELEKDENSERRLELLKAKTALFSDDEEERKKGEEKLLERAGQMSRKASFDGWGDGLFNIARMMKAAQLAQNDALLQGLTAELRRIDPVYDPLQ